MDYLSSLSEKVKVINNNESTTKTNRRNKTEISLLKIPYTKTYKCFICRKDFPSLITRICHVKLHFFKNYGSCLLCGYSSNIFLEYCYHLITHSVSNKLTYSRNMKKTEQDSTISFQTRHQDNARQNCIYRCDKNCPSSQRDNKPDCRMCKYCGSMKVTLTHNCHICENCLKKNHLGLLLRQSKNLKIKCRCYLCKKQFATKTNLVNHVRVHFSCSSFSCEFCNRRFLNKNNWKNHVELHKKQSDYKCDVCDVSFEAKYSLNWHLQQHNLNSPYQCEVCKKLFLFKNLLIQHNLQHHSYVKNDKFLCTYCKQQFSELDYLKQHLIERTGGDTYKCNICDKLFKLPDHLSKHMNRHLAIQKYVGGICHKALNEHCTKKGQLKIEPLDSSEVKIEYNDLEIYNNIIKWDPDLNILEEPTVLKKEYGHKVSLDNETEDYNYLVNDDLISNNMDYKCSTCFKQFKNNNTFIAHIKTHRDVIQCGTCCQEFENMESLVGHMKVHMKNIEKKEFECSTCFQRFQDNESLLNHVKMHNTNIECPTCNQVFGDHESLIKHGAIHITTFECPTCFKQFEDRKGLDNHVKVHNIKIECSTCFQNFKDYDCLVDHIKVHVDSTSQECNDQNSLIKPSETECLQSVKDDENVGTAVRLQKKSKYSKKYKDNESSTACTKKVSVKRRRSKINKCLACLQEFPNKWLLNRHVRNLECPDRFNPIHRKKIKCATCSEQFQNNESFINHMLTHSMSENDEKPEIVVKVEELLITEKVDTRDNENDHISKET